jgi:hypothetical protein
MDKPAAQDFRLDWWDNAVWVLPVEMVVKSSSGP